jgi:5-aminopentanamidase
MADPPLGLPPDRLRLACLQAAAVPGDLPGNLRRAAGMVADAARQGARVAVLPELHLSAYDLDALAACPGCYAVAADDRGSIADERMSPLIDEAVRSGVLILMGAAVCKPDRTLANSIVAVDSSGAAYVAYDKQHLWQADEARLFTAGHGGTVLDVDGWRLGLAICYDMSFPEHARSAALSGAHAYLCASAFATGAEHRAAVYMPARALENTIYSAFVNPVGGPGSRPSNGGSAVYAPDGQATCLADTGAERILVAELDPGRMGAVRAFLHMLAEQQAQLAQRGPAG